MKALAEGFRLRLLDALEHAPLVDGRLSSLTDRADAFAKERAEGLRLRLLGPLELAPLVEGRLSSLTDLIDPLVKGRAEGFNFFVWELVDESLEFVLLATEADDDATSSVTILDGSLV